MLRRLASFSASCQLTSGTTPPPSSPDAGLAGKKLLPTLAHSWTLVRNRGDTCTAWKQSWSKLSIGLFWLETAALRYALRRCAAVPASGNTAQVRCRGGSTTSDTPNDSVMCDIETLMASAHSSMPCIAEKLLGSCCRRLHTSLISPASVPILSFSVREIRSRDTTKVKNSRQQVAETTNVIPPCTLSHSAELETMLMLPMYRGKMTIWIVPKTIPASAAWDSENFKIPKKMIPTVLDTRS